MAPATTNGRFRLPDPMMASLMDMALNAVTRSLSTMTTGQPDKRRDIFGECGLGKTTELTATVFKDMYDRDGVAARVVEVEPQECWKIQPTVYEIEDKDTITPFEQAWLDLPKQMGGASWFRQEEGSPVWEMLQRLDELSGVGSFGALLIGLDDGLPLSMPVEGVEERNSEPVDTKPTDDKKQAAENKRWSRYSLTVNAEQAAGRKLTFLRAFDESLVQISSFESNPTSPRYGMPVMYSITLNDPNDSHGGIGYPTSTVSVHWTRVIHAADNLTSSEVFGVPRMRPVYNNLYGLRKLYCASPEMYWRGAFMGLFFGTHPQLGGDVTIPSSIKDEMENYMTGLQRYMAAAGMTAQSLAPQVVDPTSQVNVQIDCICIKIKCPKRIFLGSERGQLASDQDERAWRERMRQRRTGYVTPRIIVPFVNRLILVGVLPEPPRGYAVYWPEEETVTMLEQATVAVQRTDAIGKYLAGGVESLITPEDFFTRVVGFSEEDTTAMLEKAEERNAAEGDADTLGKLGEPKPEPPPVPPGQPAPGQQPPQPGQQPPVPEQPKQPGAGQQPPAQDEEPAE